MLLEFILFTKEELKRLPLSLKDKTLWQGGKVGRKDFSK